jgi:predicted RNA methylase
VIKEVMLDREYARVGPPIEPGWTVVDIGAAHGAFALTAARAGAARVIAVEPAPDTCALLVDNLRRNAAERVETPAGRRRRRGQRLASWPRGAA